MIVLVTADAADGLDPDLQPLAEALRSRLDADQVRVVSWDDASFDWSTATAAVIRSTWDYTDRLDEFISWVDRVGSRTRLVNGPAVVRWSTDKRYLRDLADAGVPITPTVFVDPGHPVPPEALVHDVAVVKPTVGAGSSGARRCRPGEVERHVAVLHAEGRTAMVQPYLGGLDEHGETALCFVAAPAGGLELSHAFRKGPILRSTEVEQVGGLFAKEDIEPRVETAAERALGKQVLSAAAEFGLGRIDFARVDVAPHGLGGRDDAASLVLMELELIEPSFYLDTTPGSAERLAEAFITRLGLDGEAG